MSRKTRPMLQLDAQARALPTSGDWNTFRGEYYAATTNLKYGGFARPGAAEGDLVWQIFLCAYDASNNLVSIKWPTNPLGAESSDFEFSWTARATYVYA